MRLSYPCSPERTALDIDAAESLTPSAYEVGRHLIEGLKNPTVVRDKKAMDAFSVRPMGAKEAIQKAIASTNEAVATSSSL